MAGKIGQGNKGGSSRRLRRLVARLDRRCADFENLLNGASQSSKPCPRCELALNGETNSRHCGNCSCCKVKT